VECFYDNCNWKGILLEYRSHYNEHFKIQTKICEYCNLTLRSKEDLELHLHKTNGNCPKQPVDCIFKSIGCNRDDNNNIYQQMEMDAAFNIIYLTRENLNEHMLTNTNYHLELVHRYYYNEMDSFKTQLENINFRDFDKKESSNFISLPSTSKKEELYDTNKISIRENHEAFDKVLSFKINDLENKQKNIENDLTRMTKNSDRLRQENAHLKDAIKEYKTLCQDLHKTLALTQVSLLTLEERLINQEKLCQNGQLIWKINNVHERIIEAKSGRQTSFYSPPFYTDHYGHKMCARVYLNGDGAGKSTHVSLFLVVLRGEHDALLNWPFRHKVTFVLVDQSELKENVSDSFKPDPNSSSFRRPISEMNIASGLPLFFPLTKLANSDNGYIKDNCMFIKIMVHLSE
jgi:hypothetical protein